MGTLHGSVGTFPHKEGGIQMLAGLAPSSQTVGSLLRTPLLAKPAGKMAKLHINDIIFGNFFHHKNDVCFIVLLDDYRHIVLCRK